VAWCIEQVEYVIAIGKLQNSRRNGNATLAFNVHPVRSRCLSVAAVMNSSGFLHSACIQQELLSESGFTGVGVADDGESAPACGFKGNVASCEGGGKIFHNKRPEAVIQPTVNSLVP
jgi:hypothetical protein